MDTFRKFVVAPVVCVIGLAVIGLTSAASSAYAADAAAGVDVASAYIFRGVTINDSWVSQPYMELSGIPKLDGLTFGVWGNFDLNDGPDGVPKKGQFSEIDLYASYELPLCLESLSWTLDYLEYTYPHSELDADREVGTTLSLDTFLSPSLGVYVGVGGAIEQQVYIEGTLGHEIELTEDLGLELGGLVSALFQPKDSELDDGLSYADLNAALTYWIFSASAHVLFELDQDVTKVDENFYAVFGLAGEF